MFYGQEYDVRITEKKENIVIKLFVCRYCYSKKGGLCIKCAKKMNNLYCAALICTWIVKIMWDILNGYAVRLFELW